MRVTSRNAAFQQWEAMLTNRRKRTQLRQLLVQGVRPVSVALESPLEVVAVLHDDRRDPSQWAREAVARAVGRGAEQYTLSAELLAELAEQEQDRPEVVLVVAQPADDLARLPAGPDLLAVVLDRPTSPGNVGSIARSVDAFGGSGLVVCGHACDPYEPRAVRASTGSALTVPTVRLGSPYEVLAWVEDLRSRLGWVQVVGTDEDGPVELADADLTAPTVVVTGNETRGLSAAWREICDVMVHIPITGTASSLNAANATSVVLYEASRQRRHA
ncbi:MULTISPECIES: TrmH family RNA methyltransferase [unclassified Aeromicrobium]|uniref:TrmH family RNA methyltransferase n=1 Tax=unclassified Aeromicrobium TaxID=2633570 RepID=UPI000AF8CCE9|nr:MULTISPECIES: TrmH family RNA methyltransferase [unclassified Aeromicrobium]